MRRSASPGCMGGRFLQRSRCAWDFAATAAKEAPRVPKDLVLFCIFARPVPEDLAGAISSLFRDIARINSRNRERFFGRYPQRTALLRPAYIVLCISIEP
jgi:hypothetical protein